MTSLLYNRKIYPIQEIGVPEPWSAAIVKVGKYPIVHDERKYLNQKILRWWQPFASKQKLTSSTWIQMNALHLERGSNKLSENGRTWLPMTGLGVWPDREPPRLWSSKDFSDRDFGTPLPPLMHTVFHVSAGPEACDHARTTMFGSGAVLSLLLDEPASSYHARMRRVLLPPIQEPALRGHPFYVPLLDANSLQSVREPQTLNRWMSATRLYLRESVEDEGMMVVTSIPEALASLDAILHKSDLRNVSE